jgi:hypothetical protein
MVGAISFHPPLQFQEYLEMFFIFARGQSRPAKLG